MQGADEGANAAEYVKRMRKQNKLIMGIGHRIKSLSNPDMRVTIIKEYALKHFKNNKVLDFALAVEQVGSKFRSVRTLGTPIDPICSVPTLGMDAIRLMC